MAKVEGSNPSESTIYIFLTIKGHMTVAGQNLKDQIRKLVELQVMDEEIFRYKRELHQKPAQLESLKTEFDSKKVKLKGLEDKCKSIQVSQKELELDLKAKEEGIARADASLGLLKTNKEYQARLLEIENMKADRSIVEEKILLGYDEVDAAKKSVETEKAAVVQYEKDYNAQKKQVDDDLSIISDKLKVKESQRARIAPEVRPDFLKRYERVLNNKDGLGIVKVIDHTCGGCYMHLTEQVLNELKKFEDIITCDMCARILYLADEL
jgi:predicted  nucleic acid-binding Zn-ribbon protein